MYRLIQLERLGTFLVTYERQILRFLTPLVQQVPSIWATHIENYMVLSDTLPQERKRHWMRDLGECSDVFPILKEKLVEGRRILFSITRT